jgi:hypothetical protein
MQTSELAEVDVKSVGSVGTVSFSDGSFLASILVDLTGDAEADSKFCTIYENERLKNFNLSLNGPNISIFSGKELLDGGNLTWFSATVVPKDIEDIYAFRTFMAVSNFWALVVHVTSGEILFVVNATTGEVVFSRKTEHSCGFKTLFRD